MIDRRLLTFAAIICSAIFLSACGGDSHGAYSSSSNNVAPTAPTSIAGNAGDGAVSLGWEAPTTGSGSLSYNIAITPTASSAVITQDGTHALIRGLTNDTSYTFSVTAKNNAGESTAITQILKPTKVETDLSKLTPITRDPSDTNSLSGIFDPSVLNVENTLWMTYSSVNYYQSSGNTVQDVSTSLAYSNDGGTNYAYLNTIGNASPAPQVTPRASSPCNTTTCSGRWAYEVPFLVDDKTDPDSSKRFKLFALKYFLYPPAALTQSATTRYDIGAIVMWTAASPGSTSWSSEKIVLGWNLTPQELATTNNINTLNSALAECLALSEGSATTYQGDLDFVFACPNSNNTQKIVLLRSTDHASTFKYVSTPLTVADATSFGALYFSAPSLLPTESSAPVLIATPVINRPITGITPDPDAYSGCKVFPFADEETGSLFRNNDAPLFILEIQYTANHSNGACAWDHGASGILMNDFDASASEPFSILNTAKRL